MQVSIIETSGLGDRSYLVSDGDAAIVIDPQRDIDRVLALAREREVDITHVFRADLATCDAACPRLATLELAARQPSRDKARDLAALMFPRIIARIGQLLSLRGTTRTISRIGQHSS